MIRAILTGMTVVAAMASSALADWRPLVSPEDLVMVLEDEPVVLDIRTPSAYAGGHIETAVNVPYAAWRGPDSNPGALISDDKLSLILSEAGVEQDVPVIVTYQGKGTLDFGSAARVYWTLKSAGVEQIAILNGGIEAWTRAGQALSTQEGSNFPSDRAFSFAPTWLAQRDDVRGALLGASDAQFIDARPAAFFTGHKQHDAAAWPGTLRGAINLVHETWFAGAALDGDSARIAAVLAASGYDPAGPQVISFCNTGHWAATNWFVLSELAGIDGVKLYPESMVGWTRAISRVAQN